MSRATITDTGHAEVILRTTGGSSRFVDDFYRSVPRRSRRWTGARWMVSRECLPRLEALCRRHFEHVEIREAA